MPIRILHIIQQLSLGGAARAMLSVCKYSSREGNFDHRIISLLPADGNAWAKATEMGIPVVSSPTQRLFHAEINDADEILLHYWNNPELMRIIRSDLPPTRLLIWTHIAGDLPPQVIPQDLIKWSDRTLTCTPYTLSLPEFETKALQSKIGVILSGTDFERLCNLQPKPHNEFNVGYIGTVSPLKMHPKYIDMSSNAQIPNVRFIVCGNGDTALLLTQAKSIGTAERFDFRGYVEDIKSVLEILDVFGYPSGENTTAAAELSLEEAMAAGIPPVVFPIGGIPNIVTHNETGLIVHTSDEYTAALEYLYRNPDERSRLGKNAQIYAQKYFSAQNMAAAFNREFLRLYKTPKTTHSWVYMGELNPSQIFADSLGTAGKLFRDSQAGSQLADSQIAESDYWMRSDGSGGILHYRNAFPQDGWLRYWSGLVEEQMGDLPAALIDFTAAIKLNVACERSAAHLDQIINQRKEFIASQAVFRMAEIATDNILLSAKDNQIISELKEQIERITEECNSVNETLKSVKGSRATKIIRRLGFWKWLELL